MTVHADSGQPNAASEVTLTGASRYHAGRTRRAAEQEEWGMQRFGNLAAARSRHGVAGKRRRAQVSGLASRGHVPLYRCVAAIASVFVLGARNEREASDKPQTSRRQAASLNQAAPHLGLPTRAPRRTAWRVLHGSFEFVPRCPSCLATMRVWHLRT